VTNGRTWAAWLIASALVVCGPAGARAAERPEPAFSITTGVGNAVGWTGVQGERYLNQGRLSVFAGVGYVIGSGAEGNLPTGFAGAGGVRMFTGGLKHRAFLEGSVSEVCREWWSVAGGIEQAHRYGPGVQLGYQLISQTGFTSWHRQASGMRLGRPTHARRG
jgi:hypothetical protein